MILVINDYKFEITKNNAKNAFVCKCITDSTIETIYGDSMQEAIDQAENEVNKRYKKE